MNKYRFFYMIWLLPAYLLFITIQQGLVHQGAIDTYENGETYLADITDFDIKQIAAQSNGYADIRFEMDGEIVERKLTLSVQMAQKLLETSTVPLRYKEDSFQQIVLIPTYTLQKSTSILNLFMALIGLTVTIIAAALVQRYANKKIRTGDEELIIERVDQ
ncbi:hypothetical protein AB2B38_011605 [Balneola sp. MJW-20]|uniref:hypothetical protein n=1 Tax=Gracilimonas aurantiaca TaxID=3234185 RepID=UPI00390AFE3F